MKVVLRAALVRSTLAGIGVLALAGAAACGAGTTGSSAGAGSNTVTVYSADGLHSDTGNDWDNEVFAAFTKQTGIKVDYVENGSGAVVQRLAQEKADPQADVLVTLPPFIQQASSEHLLSPFTPAGANEIRAGQKDPAGEWYPLVNDYLAFIYDSHELSAPPTTWQGLLSPTFKGKVQYSTPGVAGDGTGVLIDAMQEFGGEQGADAFLKRLQANNVGPSASTGALEAKVNKGELLIANGDLQMNYEDGLTTDPNMKIFFLDGPSGAPTTFALPYDVGLVRGAPHTAAAKKLIDFMLSAQQQALVSSLGGGLPVREDIHPTDSAYHALTAMLHGVTIFTPDWNEISAKLETYVTDWQNATGSI